MDRSKKLILLMLAVLDIIVIGVLGLILWQTARPDPISTPSYTPCVQMTLGELPRHLSPTVSWTSERLDVRLTAQYDVATPPPGSAQWLWSALDVLSKVSDVGCTLPPDVVIVVTARGTEETIGHITKLSGADITAWSEGELEETALVERAAYRVSPPGPPESQPDPARYPP